MNNGRWSQFLVSQDNHTPTDALPIGTRVLKVTIRAHPSSGANVFIGLNQNATAANLLEPGDSVTYHDERVYQDGNEFYVAFDPIQNGGLAIVEALMDSGEENCTPQPQ